MATHNCIEAAEAQAERLDMEKEKEKEGESSGTDVGDITPPTPPADIHDEHSIHKVPNGGLTAWLQVVGAHFLFFNTWGVVNSFGAYQTYYKSELLQDSAPSAVSLIGAIQAFLLMIVGALTGPLYDAGHFRLLLLVGSFLLAFGQMMLSLCTEYWQVLLAQAFCVGAGAGCLFIPTVAILTTYFSTRLATAIGIAATGSGVGGIVYPVMVHKLIGRVGFPWTARAMGFVVIGTLLVPIALMKMRVLPASRRRLFDPHAFKEPPFDLFVVGTMLGLMGLFTPFFYIQLYALDQQAADSDFAFYLLSIMNAASIFGRVIPNIAADKIGPFNSMIPCAFACSILAFCLIRISSLGPTIVFCILYGFFSGTFISLPLPIIVSLTSDRRKAGARLGMAFLVMSIGMLTGTPIAGAILSDGGYTRVWIYTGSTTMCCALMVVAARVWKVGWGIRVKA